MRLLSVIKHRVPLMIVILGSLALFLVGSTFTGVPQRSLRVIAPSTVLWGLLMIGVALSALGAWCRGKTVRGERGVERHLGTPGEGLPRALAALAGSTGARGLLGPALGLLIWGLPLGLDPVAQRAIAIVGCMLVYWMTAFLDYGVTALLGCLLFWVLHVAPPAVAFGGFSTPTPWFCLGGMLLGQAASQTGLAKRLGSYVVSAAQGSPTRILLGFTVLVFVLGLCMTTSAQVAVLAPVAMGVVATLGLPAHSNMAKGVFLVLCYVGSLCSNMILSSAVTILAWGIVEQQTGVHIFWSHWLLAFLPLIPLTILASWWTIRWLYPPETSCPLPDQGSAPAVAQVVGPWSWNERKVLGWLLLAITLWSTDFWHHLNPAAIAMAMGLILTLPGLGVLDVPAIKSVNFLIIVLVGGVLSMAEVLTVTQALAPLTAMLGTWHEALLANAWRGTLALYWGGFLYHFLIGAEFTMVSTMLPVLLDLSTLHGYNPAAVAMLWLFAGGGKLFIYQNTAVVFAYSFGVFQPKDLLKVGAVLTVIEGLFILLLVPLYWPLIGLPWRSTPQAVGAPSPVAAAPVVTTDASQWQHDLLLPVTAAPVVTPPTRGLYVPGTAALHTAGVSGVHLPLTWAQIERQPNQFDWYSLEQHPIFVSAVRAGKHVGLQVELQGVAGTPAVPAWAQVPQLDVATGAGPSRRWPVVWSPQFQTAFARFVAALGQRYDGDPRLAYVVMTEGTAIPYAHSPHPWDAAGYSPAGYSAAYRQLYQMYRQAFARTPLVAAISHLGQESQAVLQSRPEGQALQELLTFAGQQGLHFLVPEVYTRQAAQSLYVRDALLRPVLRQYASRSQLLVKLDPGDLQGERVGAQTLQMVQEQWPEIPVWVVIPTR